jgi:hypothetical protein
VPALAAALRVALLWGAAHPTARRIAHVSTRRVAARSTYLAGGIDCMCLLLAPRVPLWHHTSAARACVVVVFLHSQCVSVCVCVCVCVSPSPGSELVELACVCWHCTVAGCPWNLRASLAHVPIRMALLLVGRQMPQRGRLGWLGESCGVGGGIPRQRRARRCCRATAAALALCKASVAGGQCCGDTTTAAGCLVFLSNNLHHCASW